MNFAENIMDTNQNETHEDVLLKKNDLEKKIDYYNRILANSSILYLSVDLVPPFSFQYLYGNLKHFGISKEYLDQHKNSVINIIYSPDAPKVDRSFNSLHNGEIRNIQIECRIKTNLAEYRWIEIKGVIDTWDGKNTRDIIIFISDITQKKLSEASLKYNINFTNSLIDSIPIPIYYKNLSGEFLGVNVAYANILNKTKNQIIGSKIEKLIPREQIGKCHQIEEEVKKTGIPQIIEDKMYYNDNTWHSVLVSLATYMKENLRLGGVIGIINDITELKTKENELIESELNYKRLTSQIPEIVLVFADVKIIFVNEAIEVKLGYKIDEVLNHSILDFVETSYHELIKENARKRIEGEKIEDYKVELTKKNGGTLSFIVRGSSIQFNGQKAGVVVFVDITEKEKSEERLRDSEMQFRTLWENSFNGMRLIDESGKIITVNKAFCKMVGKTKEELEGQSFTIIYPDTDQVEKIQNFLDCLTSDSFKTERKSKVQLWNGKIIWWEYTTTIMKIPNKSVLFLSVFKDISQIVEIERQLSLSQKMESVGLLAAGIAHEINSPMQFIGDNNSFLKDSLKSLLEYFSAIEKMFFEKHTSGSEVFFRDEIDKNKEKFDVDFLMSEIPIAIEQTQSGIERVNKIIFALKDFAHPSAKEKSLADINRGIEVTCIISKNQWKYVADLETILDPELPYISCLIDEINQVILNMIVNSVHAIEERFGKEPSERGKIIIETSQKNDYVEITVKDNGKGIKPENLSKIFDPFFTTKEVGKGTGQGLSIVHDIIVNKHNGSVSVDSEFMKGTTFHIKLPKK